MSGNASQCVTKYAWMNGVLTALDTLDMACNGSTGSTGGQELPLPTIDGLSQYTAATTICRCNRVYFNVYSGCQLCQNVIEKINITWSQWTKPCPLNSTRSQPGLGSENLPKWAVINTTPDDIFDVQQARDIATNTHPHTPWSPLHIALVTVLSILVSILLASTFILIYLRHHQYANPPSSPKNRASFLSFTSSPAELRFPFSRLLRPTSGLGIKKRPYKVRRMSSSGSGIDPGPNGSKHELDLTSGERPSSYSSLHRNDEGYALLPIHNRQNSDPVAIPTLGEEYVSSSAAATAGSARDTPRPSHSRENSANQAYGQYVTGRTHPLDLRVATATQHTLPHRGQGVNMMVTRADAQSQSHPNRPDPRNQPLMASTVPVEEVYMRHSAADLSPVTPLPSTPPGFR